MTLPLVGKSRRTIFGIAIVLATLVLVLINPRLNAVAGGGGGTAKPPKGAVSPWVIPTLGNPQFTGGIGNLHGGFDDTGLLTATTVGNDLCPTLSEPGRWGGTAVVNGIEFTIPCNLIVQMPANTLSWADFVNGRNSASDVPVSGLELRVVGNIVGSRHIAGLAFASQLGADTATGVVTGFNYAQGEMTIASPGAGDVTVQINDPVVAKLLDSNGNTTGRHSAGQSEDPRFSVDQDNPTIHAGTGYPMCIPRTDPSVADDPLCPQSNRPKAATGCRNFSQAGVAPPVSGELTPPAAGQVYCSQFVMKRVSNDPLKPCTVGVPCRTATDPDPAQQAPFEIGDSVTFAGTKIPGRGSRFVSAHTIEANVGIYTQPTYQPSYVAIGEFGVGTADPVATAVNGAAQETQDRIFLESETTDVKTPVDIYYEDASTVNPDGSLAVRNRWTTPFEMTGENPNTSTSVGPSGGITTQNSGPQPQRARIRATKAPAGLLSQPARTVRIAQRSLCMPTPVDPNTTTENQAALDQCFLNNEAHPVANGLAAGQYVAPVFEYIFPENVRPGDSLVPIDLWHLPFLRSDQAGSAIPLANSTNPEGLVPSPW